MSSANVSPAQATRSVLCIGDSTSFQDLQTRSWQLSGLLNWNEFSDLDALIGRAKAEPTCCVLLLTPLDGGRPAQYEKLARAGLAESVLVLDSTGGRTPDSRTFGRTQRRAISPHDALRQLLPELPRAAVAWSGADDATELAKEKAHTLPLLLEKYFPGWSGTATFDVVDGGRSGDSLLCFSWDGGRGEFYFKFYKTREAFVREWTAHNHLLQSGWLAGAAIGFRPVPDLPKTGSGQLIAFPTDPAVSCLESARKRTRLSRLYASPQIDDRFIFHAYDLILKALTAKQPISTATSILSTCRDIGPGSAPDSERTLLGSLRAPRQRSEILNALESLRPYVESDRNTQWNWPSVEADLAKLLGIWEPPCLHRECPVQLGHVHGDANSRNFLFDGDNIRYAGDLQIVDLGGYRANALRVFDLAQLEADLKILLMGTEPGCRTFLDINPDALADWKREEERSIDEGLTYVAPKQAPPEILRAYSVIQSIRQHARAASSGDDHGRAYLFCLLYWTLRKVRLVGVAPEIKRILAAYSSHLIIRRLVGIHEK